MSKPRYDWWPYVKGMIRRHPDMQGQALRGTRRREYEAVQKAMKDTKRYRDGAARMRFIEAAYWGKSATLEEAALENMVPWQTAKKWHSEFVRLVASHYGLMD